MRPFNDHELAAQDYVDLVAGSLLLGAGVFLLTHRGTPALPFFIVFGMFGCALLLAGWLGSTDMGYLDTANEKTFRLKRILRLVSYLPLFLVVYACSRCSGAS